MIKEEKFDFPTNYESKKELPTVEERKEAALKFIESLSVKPVKWKISGSTSEGNFRPTSDLDIDALYDKDSDIPYEELDRQRNQENGLVDGFIDFHYFARDWEIYKHDPSLLKRFEDSFS